MKTVDQSSSIHSEQQADEEAVVLHVLDGIPLDPDVAQRVQERGRRITEEIRRAHGLIDDETFQSLLDFDASVALCWQKNLPSRFPFVIPLANLP